MIVTNVLLKPQGFAAVGTVNLCREIERNTGVSQYDVSDPPSLSRAVARGLNATGFSERRPAMNEPLRQQACTEPA